ncbi:DUF2157 domain-containing protein [Kiloniella laminariae]|uniref:DUF2157 domain-containing protein n=1 Tax=Kiloniella laminariae TaxID=454162 RepID=A0ABT4LIP9_9PROT|nr:DUF2157 domain-containing protein [Kiloniella laminariae]MCZ4279867.1 DUF2157 domain-containing protein [Kiloniella laminariae]
MGENKSALTPEQADLASKNPDLNHSVRSGPTSPLGQIPLDQILADRGLIDGLYAAGILSREARDAALQLLIPHRSWALWISRLLLVLATALILAGIVFFSAFNWNKTPPLVKFGLIEAALLASVIAALLFKARQLPGQLALLAASVLIGVFLAVFGQIYQTGADVWQLFAAWALLAFGWTLLSNFAAQWVVWLVIVNIAIGFWWDQAARPERDMVSFISGLVILVTGSALVLRECLYSKNGFEWLQPRWTRWVLLVPLLALMMYPLVFLFFATHYADKGILYSALLGLAGYIGCYRYYGKRLKVTRAGREQTIRRDIPALAAVIFSLAVVIEFITVFFVEKLPLPGAISVLFIAVFSFALFCGFIYYLRRMLSAQEAGHG